MIANNPIINPLCKWPIGRRVKIRHHITWHERGYPGPYDSYIGKIIFTTQLINAARLFACEQVTIKLDKGPTVILSLGPDKINPWVCGYCGEANCDGCGENSCDDCGEVDCIC